MSRLAILAVTAVLLSTGCTPSQKRSASRPDGLSRDNAIAELRAELEGKQSETTSVGEELVKIASVRNEVSRDVQINVLRATAGRMAEVQSGPSDLMRAAYPALKLMRDEYLELELRDPDQLESFGKALAPALCDVCTVANQHWKLAQSDAAARVNYGGAVQISENLLKLIDSRVRPRQDGPRTELGPAWRNRDEQRFAAE